MSGSHRVGCARKTLRTRLPGIRLIDVTLARQRESCCTPVDDDCGRHPHDDTCLHCDGHRVTREFEYIAVEHSERMWDDNESAGKHHRAHSPARTIKRSDNAQANHGEDGPNHCGAKPCTCN